MFDKALFALPGIRRILAALAALSLAKAACVIGQAFFLAGALASLWAGSPFSGQWAPVLAFLGCFLARQAAAFVQDALLARYARSQGERLRTRLLERAFRGSVGWVRAHGTASVTSSALEGISQVESYLRIILPKTIDAAVIVPLTLAAAFALDWPSGVILLVVVPVIVFYMVMLGRMARDRAARQYGSYQVLANHFVDTLRGLPTLKALGAGRRQLARVFEVSERFRRATVKTLRVATLSSVVLDLLATLGVAAVAMMLGFRLVDGGIDLFTGLAILIIAPEYFAPLREFAGDFHASLDGKNALADILSLTGEPDEAPGAKRDADGRGDDGRIRPAIAPWGLDSTLAFEGVTFAYPADGGHAGASGAPSGEAGEPRAVLDGIGLEARGFERIGIVGPSGAGKSTLASLVAGFGRPDGGTIRVDGVDQGRGGLQRASWRSQVLYIPQDPYIFHATLRDNIAFYTPDADEARLREAVEACGLTRLVEELPDGLDTVIGAGGRGLSGGQAQRIALARAFLDRDRRILVFDEPSAHLDIETELELKERMLPLMEGRLVFFATHRMHWLENMDRVLVVEDGAVTEIEQGALARTLATGAPSHPGRDGAAGAPCHTEQSREAGALCHPERSREAGAPCHPERSREAAESKDLPRPKGEGGRHGASRDEWVRPYFGRYRKELARALGLGAAAVAFAVLLMVAAGYLISGTAEARGSVLYYYLPIAFVQLFGLGKPLLRYLERLQSHDWVFRMTSSLRVRLFKALERQASPLQSQGAGEVLGMVADDIGHIQNLYLRTVFPLVIAAASIALAALGVACFDFAAAGALLAALSLAAGALPLCAMRANRGRAYEAKARRDEQYRALADDMLGASDWVFAGRGAACAARHRTLARAADALQDASDRWERACRLAMMAIMGVLACAVMAWAAGAFGGAPGGRANWIAALVLGVFPLLEVYAPLPAAAMQANVHRAAIRHLNEFPAVDDGIDGGEDAAPACGPAGIRVKAAAFSYPDGTAVLDGLDLEIPPGQRIALLGRSGSGKSTLASLIRGDLAPDAGDVLVGGVPACRYGDAMAQAVGIVQQDAYLFDRSLRENIVLGKPDASDDEVWAVLERVGLAAMVRRLPRGLDTRAGEAGKRFSGGERHRVALARVLLADAPIILLDEATVGLDPATEQGVLDTLLSAAAGKTLVMITHHLQGIDAFDRVVFLEDGRIEMDGTPAGLAQSSERYRSLLDFDRSIA